MLSTKDKKILDITKKVKTLDLSGQLYIAGLIKGLELSEQKININ